MPYTMRHTIETDVDKFWQLYFDTELNQALFGDLLNYSAYEVVEERIDDQGVVHRRVEYTPSLEVPAVARKLVGDGGYSEIGRYVPGVKYAAQWVPRRGADKFTTRFELWAEPSGQKCCERVMVVENTVRVFGISSVIARLTEQSQRDVLGKVADFINGWIQERGL
ncbi:MAG TPA: DUF2505 family protein [Polyangiaceae bacterium]|nr:DUF2505 family protein [Polyangiaceae bacterium]